MLKTVAMDSIDAECEITRRWSGMRVLILTTYDQNGYALGGLSAGASGILLKDVQAFHLAQAVRDAFAGEVVFTPRVTREVVDQAVPVPRPHRVASASHRSACASSRSLRLWQKGYPASKSLSGSPSRSPPSDAL